MSGKVLFDVRAGRRFPVFSVTGSSCSLRCGHCGGRYLAGMEPLTRPEDLATRIDAGGISGFLLSGGCDPFGAVPLEPYLFEVRRAVGLGLRAVLHPGLFDPSFAPALAATGAVLALEVPASDAVVRGVYGLRAPMEAYLEAAAAAAAAGARCVPHLTVGLPGAGPSEESAAVASLAAMGHTDLVVNAFLPTRGTALEQAPGPRPERVAAVVRAGAERGLVVRLGCMRPRGPALEIPAVEAGARAVVNLSGPGRRLLALRMWRIDRREGCCAAVDL